MEVLLDLGELRGQEAPVGADRVAGQRDRPRLGDVQLEELQCPGAGVFEAERRRLNFGEQPRPGVHGDDEVIHLRQLLRRGVDHEIGALGHDVQIVVGHQAGDLDDDVTGRFEARHFQIDPGQHGPDATGRRLVGGKNGGPFR